MHRQILVSCGTRNVLSGRLRLVPSRQSVLSVPHERIAGFQLWVIVAGWAMLRLSNLQPESTDPSSRTLTQPASKQSQHIAVSLEYLWICSCWTMAISYLHVSWRWCIEMTISIFQPSLKTGVPGNSPASLV